MKDGDLRRVLGLTWAGWLNVFLQSTGFRLWRVVESDGSISAWCLRWSPIWRNGWSLPTGNPRPPGYPGAPAPVARTAGGGRILVDDSATGSKDRL